MGWREYSTTQSSANTLCTGLPIIEVGGVGEGDSVQYKYRRSVCCKTIQSRSTVGFEPGISVLLLQTG
jgi:hypothetical protein